MFSLNLKDRIWLIDCPQAVFDVVDRCIREQWPKGIQKTSSYDGCTEYKLKGYPWLSNREDGLYSRFLITIILQSLAAVGWVVHGAMDMSVRRSYGVQKVLSSLLSLVVAGRLLVCQSGPYVVKLLLIDN